jgi:hypothetical protein
MNFLVVPFFLILIIGSLSIIFLSNFQSISPQSDTNSSSLDNISVKITSPSFGKKVPTGELTISGISSDNQAKNCIVFVDWNDLKPFQPVRAAGPGGIDDFSEWIFTYDSKYHEIIEGDNELTSKITCLDGNKPLTKWNSLNLTGYNPDSESLSTINQNNTSIESTDNQQVPLQTVMPGANPKTNDTNMVIEQNTTSLQLSNATTTVEKNAKSLQLSNITDSEIEMVVPNESLNEKQINNTNTGSTSEGGKSTITNFTTNEFSQSNAQNPRIDLDEQPPTDIDEEQQQPLQQQQQQPPTDIDEEQQQPLQEPNLDNRSEAVDAQPPQSENSPTQGIFPPFDLPSIFP